jgi:hypothetical protein
MHYMADTPAAADTLADAGAAAFAIGDVVHDRDDPDPSDAIVVNLPSKTAAEWIAYRASRRTQIAVKDVIIPVVRSFTVVPREEAHTVENGCDRQYMEGTTALYWRVSTADQDLSRQRQLIGEYATDRLCINFSIESSLNNQIGTDPED